VGLPSYKDVLLSSTPLVSHPVAGDGWVTVVSRRARWRRPRPSKPPPRPIPVDVRGKCFNCFSPSHRAAVCRRPVRCFSYGLPGHRAHVCPRRRTTPPKPLRAKVWRPVSHALPSMGASECIADGHEGGNVACSGGGNGAGSGGGEHRRTRRGHRRRRPNCAAGADGHGVPPGVLPQPPPEAVRAISMSPSPPRRFIKRSRRIGQAKDDLRRALIISIVGMGRSGCAAKVSDALTSRFDLKDDVLDLRRVAPNTFVALLPNVEMADRMLSGGQSFYVPPLRMHIKRWSRQFMASDGGTLPHRLDIERRGLPFHLWGLHTAEQLLVEHCLVHELHLDSIGGSDMSAFKLSVWCHNPGDLLSLLDLHVKEPPVQMGDEPSPSRTVVYPVSILVSRPGSSPEVLPPPHF
jgi:hypothetical protein